MTVTQKTVVIIFTIRGLNLFYDKIRHKVLTEDQLSAQFVHEEREDEGPGDAGDADQDRVFVDRLGDLGRAAEGVDVGAVVRQLGHDAHRGRLSWVLRLELLEPGMIDGNLLAPELEVGLFKSTGLKVDIFNSRS